MAKEYARHGAPRERLATLPLFPSLPIAAPGVEPRDTILFLGRMTTLKGGDVLVRAVGRVASDLGRPLRLVMAGDGPQRAAWHRLAIRERVAAEFPGWLNASGRLAAMAQASVLAVPSIWPEPFGLVGLEAAARGVPAVAFDTGGISQWLRHDVSGLLVPPAGGYRGMATALATVLDEQSLAGPLERRRDSPPPPRCRSTRTQPRSNACCCACCGRLHSDRPVVRTLMSARWHILTPEAATRVRRCWRLRGADRRSACASGDSRLSLRATVQDTVDHAGWSRPRDSWTIASDRDPRASCPLESTAIESRGCSSSTCRPCSDDAGRTSRFAMAAVPPSCRRRRSRHVSRAVSCIFDGVPITSLLHSPNVPWRRFCWMRRRSSICRPTPGADTWRDYGPVPFRTR